MKLEERLKQIEKRIAELQRKADSIKAELGIVESVTAPDTRLDVAPEAVQEPVQEEAINPLPRRRGRRKLNETE